MSDDPSQKILLEPLKNIGAQDILHVGSVYEGVLRKRGGRFQTLLGSSKWKQRFVVISQGCVYCFKDEYAQRPLSAFSLSVYESVHDTNVPHVLHVFELKHEITSTPSQFFACETEAKKKTWMAYIEETIKLAHQHLGTDNQKLSSGSDEGISMTIHKRKSHAHAPLPPIPPTPDSKPDSQKYKHKSKSEYSLESDDEDDEYSEIKEHQEARATAKPASCLPKGVTGGIQVMGIASPRRQDTVSKRPALPLPATPGQQQAPKPRKTSYEDMPIGINTNSSPGTGKPDYINEDIFKEDEFFFNSAEKAEAHRLLNDQPVGTFLVRLGNSTPTVLSVQTTLGIKEFQIAENESGKVSINRTQYFPNLQTMLCFYNQNDLPKKEYSVKLIRGYNSQ